MTTTDELARGPRGMANGGYADVVAVGEFVKRSALHAGLGSIFSLCRGVPTVGPYAPTGLAAAPALGSAGVDRIALNTSARPPNTASIERPVLVPVSAHGSAKDRNCALASTICLTIPNRSKVLRARPSIRVTVTRRRGRDGRACGEARAGRRAHPSPFTIDVPVGASGGAQLLSCHRPSGRSCNR
jgi:hypothetical protein